MKKEKYPNIEDLDIRDYEALKAFREKCMRIFMEESERKYKESNREKITQQMRDGLCP